MCFEIEHNEWCVTINFKIFLQSTAVVFNWCVLLLSHRKKMVIQLLKLYEHNFFKGRKNSVISICHLVEAKLGRCQQVHNIIQWCE